MSRQLTLGIHPCAADVEGLLPVQFPPLCRALLGLEPRKECGHNGKPESERERSVNMLTPRGGRKASLGIVCAGTSDSVSVNCWNSSLVWRGHEPRVDFKVERNRLTASKSPLNASSESDVKHACIT